MTYKRNIIDVEVCKVFFNYDEEGNLYWNRTFGSIKKGDLAGCLKKDTYKVVSITGTQYLQHRILYQLYHDITLTEDQEVDHINHNTKDNKKENLRLCDRYENAQYRRTQSNNELGHKNIQVLYCNDYKYYYIRIQKDKKWWRKALSAKKYTLEEVIKIRDEKLKELHGDFACLS